MLNIVKKFLFKSFYKTSLFQIKDTKKHSLRQNYKILKSSKII
jgi:hypothetical protein